MNDLSILDEYKSLKQYEEGIKTRQNNLKRTIDVVCFLATGILSASPIMWFGYSFFMSAVYGLQVPIYGWMFGVMISSVIPGFIGTHSDAIVGSVRKQRIEEDYRYMFQKMCEDTEELCANLTPGNYTLQEAFSLMDHFWNENFPENIMYTSMHEDDERIISELKEKLISKLFSFQEFNAAHMMIYALWADKWENNELKDMHMPLRPKQDSLAEKYKRAYKVRAWEFIKKSLPDWHDKQPNFDSDDLYKHATYRMVMQRHLQNNYKQIIQLHYNMEKMFPIYETRMDDELENEFKKYFDSLTLPQNDNC